MNIILFLMFCINNYKPKFKWITVNIGEQNLEYYEADFVVLYHDSKLLLLFTFVDIRLDRYVVIANILASFHV